MKFLQFLKNGWKSKRLWLLTSVALLAFLIPQVGLAETVDTFEDIGADLVKLITIGFSFLNYLLYPLVMLISALMDNEVLIGVAMEERLLTIWVEIRNWVNIAFVMAMVGVALYNVAGIAGDGSNYALKSILPKIVIGLVAVNFSYTAGKVLIDATNVLTQAVYAMPTSLIDWDDEVEEMTERLCQVPPEDEESEATDRKIEDGSILAYMLCAQEEAAAESTEEESTETSEGEAEYFTGELNDFGEEFLSGFGQHNAALALMVNMGQITDINMVNLTTSPTAGDFLGLTLQALFSAFMFLMFGFAYVALIVVLIARVIVLWISLALSPVVVLLFVFPDLANAGGGDLDIKGQFLKHLFVPVVIGVVFSVGFTMLSTLKMTSSGSWLGKIGEVKFEDLGSSDEIANLAATYGSDLGDFESLLIAIGAIIIIWVGTFAAASQTVANNLVGSIKSAGEGLGKYIAKAPLYATVIPIGKGSQRQDVSLGAALAAIPMAFQRLRSKRAEQAQGLAKRVVPMNSLYENFTDTRREMSGETREGQQALFRRYGAQGSFSLDEAGHWKGLMEDATHLHDDIRAITGKEISAMSNQEVIDFLNNPQGRDVLFGDENFTPGGGAVDAEGDADASPVTPAAAPTAAAAAAAAVLASNSGTLASLDPSSKVAVAFGEGNVDLGQYFSGAESLDEETQTRLKRALKDYSNLSESDRAVASNAINVTQGKMDPQQFIQTVEDSSGATGGPPPAGGGIPPVGGGGPAGPPPTTGPGAPPPGGTGPLPPPAGGPVGGPLGGSGPIGQPDLTTGGPTGGSQQGPTPQ